MYYKIKETGINHGTDCLTFIVFIVFAINNPIILHDPTGMKADSTYEINTKTNTVKVINGEGGDEIDHIIINNGESKASVNYAEDNFFVGVQDVNLYSNSEVEQYGFERVPGYRIHRIGSNGVLQNYDISDFIPQKGAMKMALGTTISSQALKALFKTSSKSTAESIVYAFRNEAGEFIKFGVSDAGLKRYNQVLRELTAEAINGKVYGRVLTKSIPKMQAHVVEKVFNSLHYAKYGKFTTDMKYPFPIHLLTGKKIK